MATTTAEETTVSPAAAAKPQRMVGEWFWRFLAVVMVITVGWVLWIIYQINPQPLVTTAGFEAAAKAKARASQDAQGRITPAPAPAPAVAPVTAAAPPAAAPAEAAKAPPPPPKEPPVNVEKLRLSDAIETPIPERGKKK